MWEPSQDRKIAALTINYCVRFLYFKLQCFTWNIVFLFYIKIHITLLIFVISYIQFFLYELIIIIIKYFSRNNCR